MSKKDKIKLVFYGDAPTVATGFGTVTRNILDGLYNTGKYDIQVLGVNYWGDPHPFPYPIWPVGIGGRSGQHDPYGRQRVFDMLQGDLQYDVLFFFQDSFILEFTRQALPKLRAKKDFLTMGYFPIDGVPKRSWIEAMNDYDVPVTYTEFGRRECIKVLPEIGDRLKVIPHGVNMKDFFPLNKDEVSEFRRQFFGPHANKFIVTNVNRNQQRKDIPRTMLAFREFKKRRPNSVLYLHMATKDQGWDLLQVAEGLGMKLHQDVLMPDNFHPNSGYPLNVINGIYNASDVIVSTTLGEGWGLSTVEAMACKKPVIFPANTALTEIIGEDRGFLVKSGETVDHFTVLPHDNEILRPLVSTSDFIDKLMFVYDNRDVAQERAGNAYEWVKSSCQWDKHVVPQWEKLISQSIIDWTKSKTVDNGIISAEEL